jgi:alpha-tubulin suppressor-like RCC1 family protein
MRGRRALTAVVVVVSVVAFVAFAARRKKVRDPGLEAERLFLGGSHACAWMKDGAVRCWGRNDRGELGVASPPVELKNPVRVPAPEGAVDLALGGSLSCFLQKDGRVACWGALTIAGEDSSTVAPFDFSTLHDAVEVGVSSSFGCARLPAGHVQCWGDNRDGKLGVLEPKWWADRPIDVTGIAAAIQLAVASDHTCVLTADGAVFCWGENSAAQLGDGTHDKRALPVRVVGLGPVAAIAVGYTYSCALAADHTVTCWGGKEAAPVRVSGLEGVRDLALGGTRACALLENRTVRCWKDSRDTPEVVADLFDVEEVRPGYWSSCARMRDRTVKCWDDHTPPTLVKF